MLCSQLRGRLDQSYLGMGLRKVLGYLEENKQLKVQVERLKDTLITLNKEYRRYVEEPSLTK